MKTEIVICPDCGFVVEIRSGTTGNTLIYDVHDWRRRCERLNGGSPAKCFVDRDRKSQKNLEHVMVRSEYCKIDLNNAPSKADGIDLLTDAANKGGNS